MPGLKETNPKSSFMKIFLQGGWWWIVGDIQVFRVFFYVYIYNIYVGVGIYIYTLPETNIASYNRPSQKQSHLITIDFQGLR